MSAAEEQKEIDLSKVKQAVVVKWLKAAELSTSGSLEVQVARLQEQQAKLPNDQLADCSDCYGVSDLRAPECVFCGAGGMELPDGTPVEPPAPPPPRPAAAKPEPAKASKPKPESNVTSITKAKPTAVQPAADVQHTKRGEAALDREVKAFEVLQKKQVVSYYELGVVMKKIFDERLWTQRVDDDGKQKYKGWNQFVSAELGVESHYSYVWMDVASNFTLDQFEAVGIKKLRVILQLPKELRGQVADKAAQERLPFSEVSDEVKKLAGDNKERRDTGRKGLRVPKAKIGKGRKRKGVAATVPALKKGQLTAILTMGRVKTPLFARLKKGDVEPRRALKMQDEPWGKVSLPGGVVQYFRLVQDSKGLAIVTETRQEEPEQD